jgi:hypothetical protein
MDYEGRNTAFFSAVVDGSRLVSTVGKSEEVKWTPDEDTKLIKW